MSAQSNVAPVIIKRKKKAVSDGHHGGAWKVAYADFVTAMMAFFLLMWLLNATTEKQRKGVADYFSPTVPISRVSGGGDGNFGGKSVFSEMTLPQNGTGATNAYPTEANKARGETGLSVEGVDALQEAENQAFKEMEAALMGRGGESTVANEVHKHIVTRVTDEGLIIELFDTDERNLFEHRSSEPTELLKELSSLIAELSGLLTNGLAISGHTRAAPLVLADNPVWDLSTERANAMRLLLDAGGIGRERVKRLTGHADKSLAVKDPMAVRNNRLEIVFLRNH